MDLREFISKGWSDHAQDAASVMARLPDGIDLLSEDSHVPQLAALVFHVAGEHLGRWAEGDALLERILDRGLCAPGSPTARAVWRSRAIFAHCAGDSAREQDLMARAGSEPADRVRMLATAASALLGQKRTAEAVRDFRAALEIAAYGPDKQDPAAMALAVTGNNVSCELELRPRRSPEETTFMLEAAGAARKYWEIAGDWTNVERAEYRLSAAHLAAGDAPRALEHARTCLDICSRASAPAMELFFAHERVAYAHRALLADEAARAARDAAAACLGGLEDEGDRDDCRVELGKLDIALGIHGRKPER